MSKSLEEAAKENAAWEQQRKTAEQKILEKMGFTSDNSKAEPALSFNEEARTFTNTHIQNIRNYAAALEKQVQNDPDTTTATNRETRIKFVAARVSHLRLMADLLSDLPKKMFSGGHDKPFLNALENASQKDTSTYYVDDYAARMSLAAQDFKKLAQNYHKTQGPML